MHRFIQFVKLLVNEGIITQDEFDAKKKELLSRF
ncbi:SHOCT domain-containing protein [Pedobacter ginsengiterrae]